MPAHAVTALLREDADYLASVATVEQAAAAEDVSPGTLSGKAAMWSDSDEDKERQRRERERLRAEGGSTTVDALKHLEAQRHGLPPLGSA